MKVFILSGSHREKSQSRRVAAYLEGRVQSLFPQAQTFVFSLENNPVPLWDEGVWKGEERWHQIWDPIKLELTSADAVIVVTPEWGGMASPGVKNFLLLCSGGAIAHKAGLLVSVSASRNGAYPIAELRATSTKNNQLCLIPEHIIVRDAEKQFVGQAAASDDEQYLRDRVDYALRLLNEYARALQGVRESGVVDQKKYGNGM